MAGRRGLAGSAVVRAAQAAGFTDVVGATSDELDLRDRAAVFEHLLDLRPTALVLAAARVGGILANSSRPADFISENLQIQVNVMDAAARAGVRRLLFLGSSCAYPKFAGQPIRESSLLQGSVEPTNEAYAVAKIAGLMQVRAVRNQLGLPWISAMPTNLYGPGDNFDPHDSHVVPGLIRRLHDAERHGAGTVELWGSGTPRRELLHADDLGSAVIHLLDHYDDPEPINVGSGFDVAISDLAAMIAGVVGFRGLIVPDRRRPDGTPRKLLETTRIRGLGWQPTVELRDGLADTYAWFLEHAC
ncbi:GDP-L-fucose synthetase [Pseudonocardia sp. Ae406_Ps2]|nr:GDP-L-fucose synthetase [Pseudonocardia sp. Ae331_Ps2]OLM05268.1 GDP-L-fucose synthetase [Pseudonocardia sp. Ae406_Ps2]OLM09918.1 GDP-L-fucose synthetase [Pseudonocardia sp. Ae505_Ps2]OLM26836.1 GDP-L-fucose synthetase [Pseudonocardia sp. Ae706_Ps2]